MYRRSKFLEVLIEIRQKMAREADFDTDLFVERVRSKPSIPDVAEYSIVDVTEPASKDLHMARNKKPL